jgi:hypothetical protein
MKRERTVKVPEQLVTELVTLAHKDAARWYRQANDNRAAKHFDIAANCERYGDEAAALANEARRLLDMPPLSYRNGRTPAGG